MTNDKRTITLARTALLLTLAHTPVLAEHEGRCRDLPSHTAVASALRTIVSAGGNGGLGFNMWATVVNRDGEVCSVVFSGSERGDQWPGSRVISAQKASTANAFSLPRFALSTANLYSAVQPGGTLFGLQQSNPVNPEVAYAGRSEEYGQHDDPMVGHKVGGVNVFGGGLALYSAAGRLVGGVGVSGDTSCTDHVIAWKLRDALQLDFVPGGVATGGTDNIIYDITRDTQFGNSSSSGGFGHPRCDDAATAAAAQLPTTNAVGRRP